MRAFDHSGVTIRLGEIAYGRGSRRQTPLAREVLTPRPIAEMSADEIRGCLSKGWAIVRFRLLGQRSRSRKYSLELGGLVFILDSSSGPIADVAVQLGTYAFVGPKRKLAGYGGGSITVERACIVDLPFKVGVLLGARYDLQGVRVLEGPAEPPLATG